MLAFVLFEGMIEARRMEWRDELAELRKRKRAGDDDRFSAMKKRAGL